MKEKLSDFYGNYTSEKETLRLSKSFMRIQDTLLILIQQLQQAFTANIRMLTGDTATKTVIASTASPFKFTRSG